MAFHITSNSLYIYPVFINHRYCKYHNGKVVQIGSEWIHNYDIYTIIRFISGSFTDLSLDFSDQSSRICKARCWNCYVLYGKQYHIVDQLVTAHRIYHNTSPVRCYCQLFRFYIIQGINFFTCRKYACIFIFTITAYGNHILGANDVTRITSL